jgi:hypothetical protein
MKLGINGARPSGGKAGKGHNKTSTVRVMDSGGPGFWRIIKRFRYNVGSAKSYIDAMEKARKYIRENS